MIKKKYEEFNIEQSDLVIIIDILRACSTIVTALNSGIKEIIPCTNVSEVQNLKFKDNEILTAGERNGEKLPQFDFDNSPITFFNSSFNKQKLALTTTNCTEAIKIASNSNNIYFGCFLNSETIINFLTNIDTKKRVILFTSGYEHEESVEDNLFAYYILKQIRLKRSVKLNNFSIPNEFITFSNKEIK